MRVLFLIQGWKVASARYRVLQYLPYLQQNGVTAEVTPFPQSPLEKWRLYRKVADFDLLFIHRKRFPLWEQEAIRKKAKKIVYDFDDAVMYRNSRARGPYSRTRRKRFAKMMQVCNYALAGNSFLEGEARRYADAVMVFPTSLDMSRYSMKSYSEKKENVTLGWIGDHGSIHYLRGLRPVFEELGRRFPNLRLKIVCDTFFDCDNLQVVKKPWKAEDEISDLHSFDIGLMPLMDDLWSRGKCALKILQCQGVGVPVVCTPVGVNEDVVAEGINGYRASTHEEWVEKLSRLIGEPERWEEMGIVGRKKVLEGYSLEANAPRLLTALTKLVEE